MTNVHNWSEAVILGLVVFTPAPGPCRGPVVDETPGQTDESDIVGHNGDASKWRQVIGGDVASEY